MIVTSSHYSCHYSVFSLSRNFDSQWYYFFILLLRSSSFFFSKVKHHSQFDLVIKGSLAQWFEPYCWLHLVARCELAHQQGRVKTVETFCFFQHKKMEIHKSLLSLYVCVQQQQQQENVEDIRASCEALMRIIYAHGAFNVQSLS